MKTAIGFLVWLVLRVFVLVARRKSFTFASPAGVPYMTRWPLWTRQPWPDAIGRTGGEGWYLHHMVASDYERLLHNHPAPGAALVLRGGYWENRCEGRDMRKARHYLRRPLSFHVLDSETFHRVEMCSPADPTSANDVPSWSLFYIGPRRGPWGFLQPDGTVSRADHHDGNTGATVRRST